MGTQINNNSITGAGVPIITPNVQFADSAFADGINQNFLRINSLLGSFKINSPSAQAYLGYLDELYDRSGYAPNPVDLPTMIQMTQQITDLTQLIGTLMLAIESVTTGAGQSNSTSGTTNGTESNTTTNSGTSGSASTSTGTSNNNDPLAIPGGSILGSFKGVAETQMFSELAGQLEALELLRSADALTPDQMLERETVNLQMNLLKSGASVVDMRDIQNGEGPLGMILENMGAMSIFADMMRSTQDFPMPIDFMQEQMDISIELRNTLANNFTVFEGHAAEQELFMETVGKRMAEFQSMAAVDPDDRDGYSLEVYKANSVLRLLANGASLTQVEEMMAGSLGDLAVSHAMTDTKLDLIASEGPTSKRSNEMKIWMQESMLTTEIEKRLTNNPDLFTGKAVEEEVFKELIAEREAMHRDLEIAFTKNDPVAIATLTTSLAHRNSMLIELAKGASITEAHNVNITQTSVGQERLQGLEDSYQQEFLDRMAKSTTFKTFLAENEVEFEDATIGMFDEDGDIEFKDVAELKSDEKDSSLSKEEKADATVLRKLLEAFIKEKDLNKDGVVDIEDYALEITKALKSITDAKVGGVTSSEELTINALQKNIEYLQGLKAEEELEARRAEIEDEMQSLLTKVSQLNTQLANMQALTGISDSQKTAFINQLQSQMIPTLANIASLRAEL